MAFFSLLVVCWASPPKDLPEILIGESTAAALGLQEGEVVEVASEATMAGARRFRVAGIYSPPPDPGQVGKGNLALKMHLPDLQQLLQEPDTVDRIALRLRDPSRREEIAEKLRQVAFGMDVYTAAELARQASLPWRVVLRFHQAIGVIALVAGAVFLIALMVLKVEERRQDLGMLRLIGISRWTVFLSVWVETLGIVGGGILGGIGLGYLAAAVINHYYQWRYQTDLLFAKVTLPTVMYCVLVAGIVGTVAGGITALRLIRAHTLQTVGRG